MGGVEGRGAPGVHCKGDALVAAVLADVVAELDVPPRVQPALDALGHDFAEVDD